MFTQWWSAKDPSRFRFIARKILHIVAVGICSFLVLFLEGSIYFAHILMISSVLLIWEVRTKLLHISDGSSYGISLFGMALALSLYIGVDYRAVGIAGFILTFADALAGIVGKAFPIRKWTPWKEEKSLLGSIVFFGATIFILLLQPLVQLTFAEILIIASAGTLVESFSYKGSDNFMIIVVCALLISIFL